MEYFAAHKIGSLRQFAWNRLVRYAKFISQITCDWLKRQFKLVKNVLYWLMKLRTIQFALEKHIQPRIFIHLSFINNKKQ